MDLYTLVEKVVSNELREKKKKGMFSKPTFKAKVAWVEGNPELSHVDNPEAYVARTLRKAKKLEEAEELEEASTAGGGAASIEGSPGVFGDDLNLEEDCEEEINFSREEFLEELELREMIRRVIGVKNSRKIEENNLRTVIKQIISEAAVSDQDPSPNDKTGINVLEDLLGKIIPVIKIDYRQLTTSEEQRKSFRSHIINATENTLKPPKINYKASVKEEPEELVQEQEDVDLIVRVDDDETFIPVDDEDKEEPTEQEKFGIEGQNETGRNMAFNTFKKIETNILKAFDLLGDKEDQELFYDYLITNLKLHFDKFEDAMALEVEEPTTDEYEQAV